MDYPKTHNPMRDLILSVLFAVTAILVVCVIVAFGKGAEPQFVVENKTTPTFQVVNKATPTCFNCTNSCCGDDCTCFGGQYYCADGKCPIDLTKPAPVGYQWQRRQGEDWKLVKLEAAPVVAAQQPFQGLVYNPTHTCPQCGYTSPAGTGTWIVQGYTAGGHIHACPRCGTRWYH